MKTAREIIAGWALRWTGMPYEHVDVLIAALAAEGFSIVETGRDPVTIEACAKVADDHRWQRWRDPDVAESVKDDIATAIRALSRSTREGKTE